MSGCPFARAEPLTLVAEEHADGPRWQAAGGPWASRRWRPGAHGDCPPPRRRSPTDIRARRRRRQ
jgi:hypothetical protein